MRLFEVADRFVDDLETVLRNLTGRGDSKHAPQSLTYIALSNILKNLGYGVIGYNEFQRIYDENPQLQPIIKDFNEKHIVLGTKVDADDEQMTPDFDIPAGGKSVDQMAHHAVSKMF